jgi:hypothetical protein
MVVRVLVLEPGKRGMVLMGMVVKVVVGRLKHGR